MRSFGWIVPRDRMRGILAPAVVAALGLGVSARAQFLEPGVTVIHNLTDVGGQFGWAVADLTDIDNPPDGVTDFIIPAPGINKVRVISGATGLDIHVLTPPSGVFFGNAVADAGDVNNDGVHDIMVGAPGTGTGPDPGRTFVFSGADGSVLHTFLGEAARDGMGSAVCGAGDVNDDDHDDVVTCASANDAAFLSAGRCYVYSGIDGSLIRTHDGENLGAGFGGGAARAGDINQDGYDEIIIGSQGANPNNDGKAYVYSGVDGSLLFDTFSDPGGISYGTFFVDGVGDVNNDGTLDVWVGDFGAPGGGKGYLYSGVDGSLIRKFTRAPNAGLGTGGQFVGDVNGDGYADALVGLWTSPEGGPVGGARSSSIPAARDPSSARSHAPSPGTTSASTRSASATSMGTGSPTIWFPRRRRTVFTSSPGKTSRVAAFLRRPRRTSAASRPTAIFGCNRAARERKPLCACG